MGPSIPPPPPPTHQSSATGQCSWCNQPINSDAIRCNSCGKLKKDIYGNKIKSYIFCIIGGLGLGIGLELIDKPDNSAGIILLVIGILSALVGIYFYVKVSQRMKSWWWV